MSIEARLLVLEAQEKSHFHWLQELDTRTDALATKLRDVVAALVQADGAIIADLADLREFVMDQAFGPDPSATQPAEPEGWKAELARHQARAQAQREGFADVRDVITEYDAEESRNWLGRVFRVPLRKK